MVGGLGVCGHCPGHKHSLPELSAIYRQTDIDRQTSGWMGRVWEEVGAG